jgi:hypothetical protein
MSFSQYREIGRRSNTMNPNLFIFIGSSDQEVGDYAAVRRMAERGGTANWSSLKDSRPGDRALIYILTE